MIVRKPTNGIYVGTVKIGDYAPVSIQSMITTDPVHTEKAIAEINRLAEAGCELVRVAVPTMASAKALKAVRAGIDIPLIADIHFDYKLALEAIENNVDGLRINPGNIGGEDKVLAVIEKAKPKQIPIRIGVNAGSLPKHILDAHGGHPTADGMVETALEHVRILEKLDYRQMKLSIKATEVPLMVEAYRKLSDKIPYPLHLGVTEAGTIKQGTIKSAMGIGALLLDGIGDTLRVSLTGDPIHEIEVGRSILSNLGLRNFGATMISCPTCGRCQVNLFDMAGIVEERLASIKAPIKVAVMGCVVNGPGEAREADFGIAGGNGQGIVFRKGEVIKTVPEAELVDTLYAPTLREVPSDADVVSQQLMLRAGFMRKTANGLYSFLPLGWRSIKKIEAIVREEMDRASAQEIMMPILQPAEIWKESGRWNAYGAEMMRINDRHDNEFCLGPTHEEMITTLVKNEINSYRQLPVNLYQIQSKFRDERRPRYGLMRSREFIMKDAYSFDVDEAGLDESYKSMYDAYTRIFTRCGLTFRPVEADSGAIGGSGTHEFMAIAEAGEADIVYCTKCDYAANIEIGKPGIMKQEEEALQELSVVDTPNASTIEAVAEMLNLPLHKTIKAVVFSIDGKVVLAIVRGDHEVNEVAVQHAVLGSVEPEMATPEELEKVGLTAGFISPVGLKQTEEFAIVVDESVMETYNVCGGANKKDAHYININPKRDFNVEDIIVAPIRLITADDVCPTCGGALEHAKGIEVGQVFKLGTKYSEALQATFLDQNGRPNPMIMGCYGIGVSRTLAAAIEQYHDENGIIWPRSIAPFEAVIVPINAKDEALMSTSQTIYTALQDAGVDVLLDDRKDRAGVKFKDADLIGYPLRITVSKNTLENNEVEIQIRKSGEAITCAIDSVATKVTELLQDL